MVRTLIGSLFFVVHSALASTYYVSTTGSDLSGDGSSGNPWATCGKAATIAVAGDTVKVATGLYAERITTTTSGTAGNPITFSGPFAVSGSMRTATNYGFNVTANYVTVQFFACSNNIVSSGYSYSTQSGISLRGHDNAAISNDCYQGAGPGININATAALTYDCYNVDVIGNRCWGNPHMGMYLVMGRNEGNTSKLWCNEIFDARITNSQNTTVGDADGMDVFGANFTIISNYIHDLYWGIELDPLKAAHTDALQTWNDINYGGYGLSNVLINANVFYTPDAGNAVITVDQCQSNAWINNIIVGFKCVNSHEIGGYWANNTFIPLYNYRLSTNVGWSYVGFAYNPDLSGGVTPLLSNNIFCAQSNIGVYNLFGAGGFTNSANYGYNLLYDADGTLGAPSANNATFIRNLNPKLINPYSQLFAFNNYKTASDGSGVDSGKPTIATHDILGNTRPQGTAFDIGAYEYSSPSIRILGKSKFLGKATIR